MGGCKEQRLPAAVSATPTLNEKKGSVWKNTRPTRDCITQRRHLGPLVRLVSTGLLLTRDWVFPALLGPDSQMETQLAKHLGLYSSRELIWPSEVTVKVIHVLETASTKGSAACRSCRMNRGRHSMDRWTVRGKLSPLITPEDLPTGETARAPPRSCYHLQQEGLARPLLTLYLWQHRLVFIWVLIM